MTLEAGAMIEEVCVGRKAMTRRSMASELEQQQAISGYLLEQLASALRGIGWQKGRLRRTARYLLADFEQRVHRRPGIAIAAAMMAGYAAGRMFRSR